MSHEPVPPSRRQFLGASLAGLGAMAVTRLSHAKRPETHSRPRKKLIGWGSDVAYVNGFCSIAKLRETSVKVDSIACRESFNTTHRFSAFFIAF